MFNKKFKDAKYEIDSFNFIKNKKDIIDGSSLILCEEPDGCIIKYTFTLKATVINGVYNLYISSPSDFQYSMCLNENRLQNLITFFSIALEYIKMKKL